MMLKELLESSKLEPTFCASLLGVAPEHFESWIEGRRSIPRFIVPQLSTIFGVSEQVITDSVPSGEMLKPRVWYKLRDEALTVADREMVGLVRKLGFHIHQLQLATGGPLCGHADFLSQVRVAVDAGASMEEQARVAARTFRALASMNHQQQGVGDWFRPFLRRLGFLVVETPLRHSLIDGCSFVVGSGGTTAPCLFANSYKSTWFRRNVVLMHEAGHVIFDVDAEEVVLDYKDPMIATERETRAQVFARECLVPESVLTHFTNQFGLKWDALSDRDLARLVAEIHVEQRIILEAARVAKLIDETQFDTYLRFSCEPYLRSYTTHALSTREYFKRWVQSSPKWVPENRNSNLAARPVRLPSSYVGRVIDAYNSGEISLGKAAEMLLMDRETFRRRFSELLVSAD